MADGSTAAGRRSAARDLLPWLLPLLTWFMVITRIRNIAEHAMVGDADVLLRNTRTSLANLA